MCIYTWNALPSSCHHCYIQWFCVLIDAEDMDIAIIIESHIIMKQPVVDYRFNIVASASILNPFITYRVGSIYTNFASA